MPPFMTKNFTQAPLPFVGQKRRILKQFKSILSLVSKTGEDWIIVDVFGGSGLLSHTAKHTLPQARVIYNDFDNYKTRLAHISETNQLRQQLWQILKDYPRQKRFNNAVQSEVIQCVNTFTGYKDLACLRSWLMFSGKQVSTLDSLFHCEMYNCIRRNDYPSADGYLDGLEIMQLSFEELIPKFSGQDKTLLILDPPYLCTQQGAYAMKDYFGLIKFLKLMELVKPPFIFFSSTRSEFIDYLNYVILEKPIEGKKFENYCRISFEATLNKDSKYEDNLVYKLS